MYLPEKLSQLTPEGHLLAERSLTSKDPGCFLWVLSYIPRLGLTRALRNTLLPLQP